MNRITLRAARVNAGMSRKQAAAKINISAWTLMNYENGKTYPDVPVIKRIEETYGVKFEDIVFT